MPPCEDHHEAALSSSIGWRAQGTRNIGYTAGTNSPLSTTVSDATRVVEKRRIILLKQGTCEAWASLVDTNKEIRERSGELPSLAGSCLLSLSTCSPTQDYAFAFAAAQNIFNTSGASSFGMKISTKLSKY